VLVNALECNKLKCPTTALKDGACSLPCNIIPCHLDIYTDKLQEPLFKTFKLSDCYLDCLVTCGANQLMNDVCDAVCNTAVCGYDLGKCGYCASDCKD
jgi:hypothetical protein